MSWRAGKGKAKLMAPYRFVGEPKVDLGIKRAQRQREAITQGSVALEAGNAAERVNQFSTALEGRPFQDLESLEDGTGLGAMSVITRDGTNRVPPSPSGRT